MNISEALLNNALRYYPQYWTLWQNLREMVLEAYVPSTAMYGSNILPHAAYYRQPAAAAVALVAIDDRYRLWQIIGRFINTELSPQERPLLIDVWRRVSWPALARKHGGHSDAVLERWEAITARLSLYVSSVFAEDRQKYAA